MFFLPSVLPHLSDDVVRQALSAIPRGPVPTTFAATASSPSSRTLNLSSLLTMLSKLLYERLPASMVELAPAHL
jgi:hypothetical protein